MQDHPPDTHEVDCANMHAESIFPMRSNCKEKRHTFQQDSAHSLKKVMQSISRASLEQIMTFQS